MSDTTSDSAPKTGEIAKAEGTPKAGGVKIGGLGRKAQKLQAMREKAAQVKSGVKTSPRESVASFKAKDSFAGTKKTSFQRKAV